MTAPAAKVGLLTAIAIVVANMVGTGVFGSLGFQVAGLPSGFPIMLLWILGGVISFCGAVCYAEMASMFPRSGGEYHLLSETWHPFFGFLAGWISVTVGFAAPIAANANLVGKYLGTILELTRKVQFGSFEVPLFVFLFSIPTVLVVTVIHLGRINLVGRFHEWFTYGKVALILLLGILGFALGSSQSVSFLPQEGDFTLIRSGAFAYSLVYVLYAYTGWNAAIYMMDEVKKPEKNVPLALLIGTLLVTALYTFVNAAFLYSTPISAMENREEVGLIAAEHFLGNNGGKAMGILISFGLISSISSMVWAGPRVSAAIGRDHTRFSLLGRTNKNGVPAIAILVQSAIVIFLLLTATFEQMVQYILALLTISSLLVVAGMVYLRFKKPNLNRPYRAWGYPVTPLVFAGTSLYVLKFQIYDPENHFVLHMKREFCYGLLTLAIGVMVYFIASGNRRKDRSMGKS